MHFPDPPSPHRSLVTSLLWMMILCFLGKLSPVSLLLLVRMNLIPNSMGGVPRGMGKSMHWDRVLHVNLWKTTMHPLFLFLTKFWLMQYWVSCIQVPWEGTLVLERCWIYVSPGFIGLVWEWLLIGFVNTARCVSKIEVPHRCLGACWCLMLSQRDLFRWCHLILWLSCHWLNVGLMQFWQL